MRKITLTIICALFAIAALAQAPQGISHQAVIRNAANELVINSPIGIKVSILQNSVEGTVVYSETHLPTSNANGLITFVIGQGSVVSGVFDEIEWSGGLFFIKTEADPAGGTIYTIEGISQILSVPYALFAGKSGDQSWNKNANDIYYQNGNVGIGTGSPGAGLHLKGWAFPSSFMFLESGAGHDAGFRIYEGDQAKWHIFNQPGAGGLSILNAAFQPSLFVKQSNSFVGIGTTEPTAHLHTTGSVRFEGTGIPEDGKVFTSDASGYATWQTPAISPGTLAGQMLYWNGTQWDEIEPGVHNQVLRLCNGVPTWGPCEYYSLILLSQPVAGGIVAGAGQYQAGDQINITATAYTDWQFVNWTDGDEVVSESAVFSYTMPAQEIILTANFIEFVCGSSTINDTDGNIYNTVLIDSQCWMKENLKTTKYLDGSPIEYPGPDNYAWQYNPIGAYAWYDNDIGWKDVYGALYNWYAIKSNNICPPGWSIPHDSEWAQLFEYVWGQGFSPMAVPYGPAYALKSCRQVASPLGGDCNTDLHPRWDSDATHYGLDAFGFSGLPGGFRWFFGTFSNIGCSSVWWSITESGSPSVPPSEFIWYRVIEHNEGHLYRGETLMNNGNSVRCLKN